MKQGPPKLLFVVNNPAFFLSHRLAVAQAAQAEGFDVHVATMDGPSAAQIAALGITHHVVPMTRSGKHPAQELRTLLALKRLFTAQKPDIVHLVTIKPVLYGGIAARLTKVPGMVAAISGLGFVFLRAGPVAALMRAVIARLYRLALNHPNSRVIFQNQADRDRLAALGAVRKDQIVMVHGSGVDLARFEVRPEPPRPITVTMASRLLVDKGVLEFVGAARFLQSRDAGIRMQLAGSPDPGNPASVLDEDLQDWRREHAVTCLGERDDVAELYAQSHVVVLPSYREGLPKSLIEAAAAGRAVVTTDVPGCRDAIEPDKTGLLVPARDAQALGLAIERLAKDAEERRRMGLNARALAERKFDIREVVKIHLALYRALLARASEAA